MELLRSYSKQRPALAELAKLLDTPGTRRAKPTRAKQPQHRLRASEKAELIARYVKGERAHELAAAFNLHRSTVASVLQEAGVRRPRSLTPDEIAEGVRLYEQGWSCARIGEHLDRNANTVWRALGSAGIKTRDSHGRER